MESRIKALREKRGIIQEILAAELGITQQMLSKYEKDVTVIKVDILKRLAEYFNVTTDYLLGMSDVKRDLTGENRLNEALDEYYDMIEVYKKLDQYDQELVWSLLQIVKKMKRKRRRTGKMINIAICDDVIATTGKIETMLQNVSKRNFIPIDTEVFWKGEDLAVSVEMGNSFDIIFLDIEMGQEDGITVARRIRKIDKKVLVVYVTSHENYMMESFEIRPFRFLVKPVSEEQMEHCFQAAYEDISSSDSYFRYSYQRISHKIQIGEILYFESNRRKVKIITEKENFELYGKLNDIEKSLERSKATFLRVHQSFLVNYRHIERLGYDFIVLNNGKRISISEDRRKSISKQYCAMEDTFYVDK